MKNPIHKFNPRLNAHGQEVFTRIDPDTGEEIPPQPRALQVGIVSHQRSLHELLAASQRDFGDTDPWDDDDDGFDDDTDFDVSDPSPNPLYTEHTPHTEGFVEALAPSDTILRKRLKKAGFDLVDPAPSTPPSQPSPPSTPPAPAEEGGVS